VGFTNVGNSSNASTIVFAVSTSVLMRSLPGGLIFCILPVSSSRFLHFPTQLIIVFST
ncbi:hypothetical protein L9F63_011562, partial [Diploptera punctata]